MVKQPVSVWGPALLPTLHSHQRLGLFCDVELRSSDGHVVMIHSCILAAASSSMCIQMVEQLPGGMQSATIDLPYILLQSLVDFIYTGTWEITECPVTDIKHAAQVFEMALGELNMTDDGPTFSLPDGEVEIQVADDRQHTSLDVKTVKAEMEFIEVPDLPVFSTEDNDEEEEEEETLRQDKSRKGGTNGTNGLEDQIKVKIKIQDQDPPEEEETSKVCEPTSKKPTEKQKDVDELDTKRSSKTTEHRKIPLKIKEDIILDDGLPYPSIYQCEFCWRDFTHQKELQHHRKSHTEEYKYKCKHCEQKFKRFNHRLRHNVVHTGDKVCLYACKFCPATFATGAERSKHQASHERPYKCGVCARGLQSLNSLRKHELLHLGDRPFKCDLCDNAYTTQQCLKRHKENHDKEKKFECKDCGKKFAYAGNLGVHQRRHSGMLKHFCTHCAKSFASKFSLMEHERVHTKEQPHMCEHCGASFSRIKAYRDHLRIHTGERPYACKTCGKTFRRNNPLRIHERTHTGVKPYKCTICNKAFTSSTARRVHEKIHLRVKPFTCSVCDCAFTRRDNLLKHQLRRHSNDAKPDTVNVRVNHRQQRPQQPQQQLPPQQQPDFQALLSDVKTEVIELVETIDVGDATQFAVVVHPNEVEIQQQ